jgi:hypothetical protein
MNNQEYKRRRKHLMQIMGDDAVAILPAALVRMRNRDAEFQFRQDSDFHYITGFDEPEAVAVLVPGREHGEYILFCPAVKTTKKWKPGMVHVPVRMVPLKNMRQMIHFLSMTSMIFCRACSKIKKKCITPWEFNLTLINGSLNG